MHPQEVVDYADVFYFYVSDCPNLLCFLKECEHLVPLVLMAFRVVKISPNESFSLLCEILSQLMLKNG